MVARVARQDQVAGQLPLCAPASVDLARVEDARGSTDELVRELRGALGRRCLIERLCRGHQWLERLEGDPEAALPRVRRVGVRDLGGERATVVGSDHERPSMLDRGPEIERRARQPERSIDLVGKRVRLLAREVTSHPTIDDLGPVGGREVDPVGEVAVAQIHADAERLEHPSAGMLLGGVVPQDAEHPDVGLRGDAWADRDHRTRGPPSGERIEVRRVGGLERGAVIELRDRVVAEPVEADVEQAHLSGTARSAPDPRGRGSPHPPTLRRSPDGP